MICRYHIQTTGVLPMTNDDLRTNSLSATYRTKRAYTIGLTSEASVKSGFLPYSAKNYWKKPEN